MLRNFSAIYQSITRHHIAVHSKLRNTRWAEIIQNRQQNHVSWTKQRWTLSGLQNTESERGQNCSAPRSVLSEILQALSKQNMNRLTNSGLLLDDICHLEESACAEKLLLMRSPEYGYNLVFWIISSCQPKQKKTEDLTNRTQQERDIHL